PSSRSAFVSNHASTTPTPPLSPHDALPISRRIRLRPAAGDEGHPHGDRVRHLGGGRRLRHRDLVGDPGRTLRSGQDPLPGTHHGDRKSTRLNSSHVSISYAVFCLKKKKLTR